MDIPKLTDSKYSISLLWATNEGLQTNINRVKKDKSECTDKSTIFFKINTGASYLASSEDVNQ